MEQVPERVRGETGKFCSEGAQRNEVTGVGKGSRGLFLLFLDRSYFSMFADANAPEGRRNQSRRERKEWMAEAMSLSRRARRGPSARPEELALEGLGQCIPSMVGA